MATIRCGISQMQKEQNKNNTDNTTKPQTPFQNTVNITQKQFDEVYTYYAKSRGKKNFCTLEEMYINDNL